jgi:hypothetical protein
MLDSKLLRSNLQDVADRLASRGYTDPHRSTAG